MNKIKLVRANNPGPMTLDGTNTWIIPDGTNFVVVDPGPLAADHLDALCDATAGNVSRILLTHGHPDHAEGAEEFARRVSATIFAAEVGGAEPLHDMDRFSCDNGSITVLSTPGHTGDSLTFLVELGNEVALLTGDTVLGRGTSVVMPPDGRLADYLHSLDRLEQLAIDYKKRQLDLALLPGHGPIHQDVEPVLRFYVTHRKERLVQIQEVIKSGITDADAIVESIYSDVPENVKAAARLSVQAQLDFLSGRDG